MSNEYFSGAPKSVNGINLKLNEEGQNKAYAIEAAQKFGIPESLLIGVISHESGFKTDPGGNGGGIGQFLETTARGYGTTQAELRSNPKKAIDLTAQYLRDEYTPYANEPDGWQKAATAYFLGGGTVALASKQGDNWLQAADEMAQQYKQGSATNYLTAVGFDTRDMLNSASQRVLNQTKTVQVPSSMSPPNINDDAYTDKSTGQKDYNLWAQDTQGYYEAQTAKRAFELGPDMQYYDDLINSIGQQISAGQLDLSKATTLLNTKLSAYKTATDLYSSDAFKFGAPDGASYYPGHEPGGYNDTVLGGAPISTAGRPSIDPMADMNKQVSEAEALINGIKIPSIPAVADMRQNRVTNYNLMQTPSPGNPNSTTEGDTLPFGPPTAMPQGPTSVPPPAPTNAAQAALDALRARRGQPTGGGGGGAW